MRALIEANRQSIRRAVREHGASNPRLLEATPGQAAILVEFGPAAGDRVRTQLSGEIQDLIGADIAVIEPADLPARRRRELLLGAVQI